MALEFHFQRQESSPTAAFSGKAGERLIAARRAGHGTPRTLVGLGSREKYSADVLRKAAAEAARDLAGRGVRKVSLEVSAWPGPHPAEAARIAAESIRLSQYRYTVNRDKSPDHPLESLFVVCPNAREQKSMAADLAEISAVDDGVDIARDVSNLPGNLGPPMKIVQIARKLGPAVRTRVLDRKACERLGMGAFLAVAKGSHAPPAFLVLEYRPRSGARRRPIVLVGKGVTFDSGGISIKPADKMEEMKHDKSGAAAVIGIFAMARQLKPRVPLIGVVPLTENLPGGNASRPGDIVRSLSGVTIEIKNTDAEGRLILADALYYAGRFATRSGKPEAIIDLATLTGACSIALGDVYAAILSNNDALARSLELAGESCGERLWRLPLHEAYERLIKSTVADVQNIPEGRLAGTIAAGMFLKKFLADDSVPWAHLDIAATAWDAKGRDGRPAGSTGIGVRLFHEFLKARADI
ncbi:leucyl aminopeptidase [bacterium]|nr:leucyl aminopeptidase [bacterium]